MHRKLARTAVVAGLTLGLAAALVPARAHAGSVVDSRGPLTVFADPYGNGTANPTDGGSAAVRSVTTGSDSTIVTLHVTGLAPNRDYGAHAHVLGCQDNKGGGHYQDEPGIATSANEVWLDFTTNDAGRGSAQASVQWTFRPGAAKAVVIHDHGTTSTGAAGPKLACLDVPF